MKKILLIHTGGTIASVPGKDGLSPAENALSDVVRALAGQDESPSFTVDELPLFSLDSTDIRPSLWPGIKEAVRSRYDSYDGFIITHGTDTLAYTAAGLSVLIENSPKPVVLTGSQIPACREGSDAFRNLRDSFAYALSDEAFGVHIVFAGHVINGMRAKKIRTNSAESMISVNSPDDAYFEDGELKFNVHASYDKEPVFHDRLNENVCILKIFPGIKRDLLEYAYARYDGIVLETLGCGGIPDYALFEDIVKNANRVIPVAVCTQVMFEGTDLARYEVGRRLLKLPGISEACEATSEAAYAALMLKLAR